MDTRRFGDWTVIRPLGSGGMGHVFEVRDSQGRHAALKVVRELSGQLLERFSRELSLLSSLGRTEGFVCLLDHGTSPAGPWIALEFAPGGDLERRLAMGPLPVEEVLRIGISISQALAIAHERELIHRDLKPANILFDESGRALIADLGLGRRLFRPSGSDDISLTASGEGLGTLGYMAPEQMESARDAGPTADLWSIGVILYECLAGRRPWLVTNPVELMQQIRSGRRPPLRELRPDCPRALEALIEDCLQLDPAMRIADAEQLADELSELLDEARDGVFEDSGLGSGPAIALMIAGAAALLIAITAVVVMRRGPTPEPTISGRQGRQDPAGSGTGSKPDTPTPDTPTPDTPTPDTPTPGDPDAPDLPDKPEGPEAGDPEETKPGPKDVAGGDGRSELVRHLTDGGWFRVEQQLSDSRLKHAAMGSEVLWLDDRRFATAGLGGLVLVHDASTGETLHSIATGHPIIDMVRGDGPDELILGDWQNGTWRSLNFASGELGEPQLVSASRGSVFFAPLRGGRRLFVGTRAGLRIVSLDRSGALQRRPTATLSAILALDLAPDRSRLAAAGQREHADGRGARPVLQLQDPETGAVIAESDLPAPAECLAFSPDGRRLAVAGRDGTLSVWSTQPLARLAQAELVTVGPACFLRAVAWSPDGRSIVCGGNDAELSLWAPDLGGGRALRRFGRHGGWIQRAAFSPDGTRVATVSNEPGCRVFRVEDGAPVVQPATPIGGVSLADRCGDKGEIMLFDRRGNQIDYFAGGRHLRRIDRPEFRLAMASMLGHPRGRFWILSVARAARLGRLCLFTPANPGGEALEAPELGVVTGLRLDDDGHTVWFADTRNQIWTLDTTTVKARLLAKLTTTVKALEPLADGRLAIVGAKGKVFVARPERLEAAPHLRLGERTWCAAIARRGRRVLVNDVGLEQSPGGKTWRLKSSRLIAASLAPDDFGRETGRRTLSAAVDRIIYSPDDTRVAVVVEDLKAILILDAVTLDQRARLSLEVPKGLGAQNVLALTGGGLLVSTRQGEVVILGWAGSGR